MVTKLKSVALRTSKLSETKFFFENNLGFKITEHSHQHFVLSAKGIRIVFIESDSENEGVELYIDSDKKDLLQLEDPNKIKIINFLD